MTPYCVKSERPVDALAVAVSREIDEVARALRLPYFLAGAVARDILLTHVHGIDTGVATRDVDFGVAVSGWDQFALVKARLVETGRFKRATHAEQRLHYLPDSRGAGCPVDIIPFGGVEAPPLSISWPPGQHEIMSVIGFADALVSALPVQITRELTVPVASLQGLALLKLFAWRDRNPETRKDAQDIALIFRNYIAAGNHDRIYGAEFPVLQAVEFDVDLAGPRLLGADVRRTATPVTVMQLQALLSHAPLMERLVTHMADRFRFAEDSIDTARRMLDQFTAGFAAA